MSCENEERVTDLEGKVEALKTATDTILTIIERPRDPVADSFRAFQARADLATGRG